MSRSMRCVFRNGAAELPAETSGWEAPRALRDSGRDAAPRVRAGRQDRRPAPFPRPPHQSQFERKLHAAEMNVPSPLQASSRQKTPSQRDEGEGWNKEEEEEDEEEEEEKGGCSFSLISWFCLSADLFAGFGLGMTHL
ncbi:hypothetical protein H8959_006378 [Pygathrix nigripes]